VQYSQLHDNCCLEVSNGAMSNEFLSVFEAERHYFMSRLDDIAMRLLFHQVPLPQKIIFDKISRL